MKFLAFSFLLIALSGCQIDLMDNPESGRTIVPDTEAKIARKLYVDSQDERKVRTEERYIYTPTGQLDRIDRIGYDNTGSSFRYGYEQYSYNSNGQLIRVSSFVQTSTTGKDNFQLSQYRAYEYPTANRTTERQFYLNMSVNSRGETYEMSRSEKSSENGKLRQVARYGFNNNQPVFQSYEMYQYDLSGRLIALEYRDAAGKLTSTTQYNYKGRTAIVEILNATAVRTFPSQRLLYDSRGRLIEQQNAGYYGGWGGDYLLSSSISSFAAPTIVKFEYLD
jgi:hypothetical protein